MQGYKPTVSDSMKEGETSYDDSNKVIENNENKMMFEIRDSEKSMLCDIMIEYALNLTKKKDWLIFLNILKQLNINISHLISNNTINPIWGVIKQTMIAQNIKQVYKGFQQNNNKNNNESLNNKYLLAMQRLLNIKNTNNSQSLMKQWLMQENKNDMTLIEFAIENKHFKLCQLIKHYFYTQIQSGPLLCEYSLFFWGGGVHLEKKYKKKK